MIIVCILLSLLLCMAVILAVILYKLLQEANKKNDGLQHVFFVLNKWNRREEQRHQYLESRLKEAGYKRIVIYGCSVIGKRIARELRDSEVEAVCFIDRNAANIQAEIPVLPDVENMPDVDAVIITVVTQYYAIKSSLGDKVKCPIVLMEELL